MGKIIIPKWSAEDIKDKLNVDEDGLSKLRDDAAKACMNFEKFCYSMWAFREHGI